MSEKKKSKGRIIAAVVMAVTAVVIGIGIVVLAYRMPTEEALAYIEAIKAFAVNRVVPVAAAVLGAVAVIIWALSPTLTKVKNAADRFDGSADAIEATRGDTAEATGVMRTQTEEQGAQLAAFEKKMNAMLDEKLSEMEERVTAACGRIEGVAGQVDRIAERQEASIRVQLIEAENRADLVKSGHAARIHEIAGQYGGEDHDE